MAEKLSPEELQHITDIVSGGGAPTVSSAKANAEHGIASKYPLAISELTGMAEPFAGAAQLVGFDKPAKYLHELQKEAEYTGRPGTGAAKFTGEMASLLAGGELSEAAKAYLAANPVKGSALTGGITSAIMPTETHPGESYEDFLHNKIKDIAEGTALGGAFGKGSQMLFAPIVGERVQTLKDMGMKHFTLGQLLSDVPLVGPALMKGEQALSSVPVLGSIVSGGRKTALEDFNRAVGNHVLTPMGETIGADTKVGHELADEIYNKVTNAYDDIAETLTFNGRAKAVLEDGKKTSAFGFLNDALGKSTANLDTPSAKLVKDTYSKFIVNNLDSKLQMTGEQFREAESNLGKLAFESYRKGNFQTAKAYENMQSALRNVIAQTNPAKAAELKGIHESFKRWLRLKDAASKRGATEGVFTPSQFASSVEKIGGKTASSRGQALMQDQAKAAESVLGNKIPDSGTAERLMTSRLVLPGASVLSGVPVLPSLGALGLYSKPGMRALTKLLTERPELLRKFAPEAQTMAATAGGVDANDYKKGGLIDKFKKKVKKYAEGGKPSLDDVSSSFNQAKANVAHTYDTAKDILDNPEFYLNKIKQIPNFIHDPAEPVSHYLQGDIKGGLKSAGDYLSEKSPEELAMGFAQPGAMGIVGSIENAGIKFTSPLKNIVSSHKVESMPGNQWSSWLESNAPKSAKKEAESIDFHDWAKEHPKLTKQDIHEYVDLNTPKIQKTNLGYSGKLTPQDLDRLNLLETENAKAPLGAIDDIHGDGTYNELLTLQNMRDNLSHRGLRNMQSELETLARSARRREDFDESNRLFNEAAHLNNRADNLDLSGYDDTKYSNWTLPGGKNYNEVTMTIPKPMSEYNQFSDMLKSKYGFDVPFSEAPLTPAERKTLDNLHKKYEKDIYVVPHGHKYGNDALDANRLLHYRTNERSTDDGKSALFLEELQSDWAQQGRKNKFQEKPLQASDFETKLIDLKDENALDSTLISKSMLRDYAIPFREKNGIPQDAPLVAYRLKNHPDNNTMSGNWNVSWNGDPETVINRELNRNLPDSDIGQSTIDQEIKRRREGLPSGPYVKDTKEWTALGLKNALKDAIEKGHDYLAWTNGAQQADRYDLSKHLYSVHLTPFLDEPGLFHLKGYDHNANRVIDEHVTENNLDHYIGKDLANKLINSPADNSVLEGEKKLEGLDLKVGGEGMKKYYDEILPQAMNDVLKQLGSKEKVHPIGVKLGEDKIEYGYSAPGIDSYGENKVIKAPVSKQMGVKITPELKQKILKEGIPKFKKGGLLAKFQKK